MIIIDVHLRAIDDIQQFVNLTNRYACPICVRQGRAAVDAKSLLGILSLDHTRPVTVEVYSSHPPELVEALSRYAC